MTSASETFDIQPVAAPSRRLDLSPIGHTLLAAVWAAIFVVVVMELRPLDQWEDLFGYVRRYSLDPYYGMAIPASALEYVLAEYGWQLIIRFFFYQGFAFDTAFLVISFASATLTSYVVLRRTGKPILLLVYLNPAMMDFFISQTRSALAMSIALLFIFRRLPIAVAGVAAAATIHTSMLLLLIPLAIDFVRRRLSTGVEGPPERHFWPAICMAAAAVLTSFQILILDFFGDRRAAYAIDDLGAGTLFTLGWTLVGLVFYVMTRRRSRLDGLVAAFNVGMFLAASVLNLYSHRFIPYFLIFMAISIGDQHTPPERRTAFLVIFAAFSAVYFSYWL